MRTCRTLLLGACLVAAAALAAGQDDSDLCAAATEDGAASGWQWISALDDSASMDVPGDVLNATVKYFDEQYVAGVGTEGEKRPVEEQWVPCTPDDLSVLAVGCVKEDPTGGETYQLRLQLLCNHYDHNDTAEVDAWVVVGADGAIQVNITDVELDVDESHTELPKCTTAFCTDCNAVVAVEGQAPVKEVCKGCVDGYYVDASGACQLKQPAGAARKLLYSGTDSQCPTGQYLYTGTYQGGCGPCTRPGCAEGTLSKTSGVYTDCVWCYSATQTNCPSSGAGANQWCRNCNYGYFWQDQGCNQCEDYVPHCADCQACNGGDACHGGTVCVQCQVGYKFRGDGKGYCVAA